MRGLAALLLGLLAALPLATELKLAENGKTAYTVVVAKDAKKLDKQAARDPFNIYFSASFS